MKLLICLAAVLGAVSAWSWSCPSFAVMDPFEITSFAGTWYNQYSKNTPMEVGSCLVSNYTYNSETQVMTINSTLKTIFGFTETMSGTAVLADSSSSEGNLNLTYSTPIGNFDYDLAVLSSDYENYVVLYSCEKIIFYPYESFWILTREQTIDKATLKIIKAAMKEINEEGGPAFSDLKANDQTDCS